MKWHTVVLPEGKTLPWPWEPFSFSSVVEEGSTPVIKNNRITDELQKEVKHYVCWRKIVEDSIE